ncbi:MAG TPA: hypothetical protein VFZ61_08395 [Polyangiales bacterium]
MQFDKIALNSGATAAVERIERRANGILRGLDRVLARLSLGGRKAPYDDEVYEFLGGPAEALRRKHYEKSLRLLWKAETHAPQLGFQDATDEEKQLREMALRAMSDEERAAVQRLSAAEFRRMLNREYTLREKQAVVAILSAVGHGEAYAWLVSAQLLAEVKSTGARSALTMQVLEEAKHFLVLRELVRAFEVDVPRLSAPEYLMLERVIKARGVEKLFGMNVLVEGIALGLFGTMSHLPGLEILRLFHLDESRHTGLPSNYFREFPLGEKAAKSPRKRVARLAMVVPAVLLIPTLEQDMAELGIDAADFGGAVIRKIAVLAERNGFELPLPIPLLLRWVDSLLNHYCRFSRPTHQTRVFTQQETTRGQRELAVEGEVFLGKKAYEGADTIAAE